MCNGPAKGAWVMRLGKNTPNLFDMLYKGEYDNKTLKMVKVKPKNLFHKASLFAHVEPAIAQATKHVKMVVANINTKTGIRLLNHMTSVLSNLLPSDSVDKTVIPCADDTHIQKFNTHIRTGHEIFIPDSDYLLRMFAVFMKRLPALLTSTTSRPLTESNT